MRNVVGPGARKHLIEGAVEDLVFPPHHLTLFPEQLLQVLHPFEIADDDTTRIAKHVGDDEDLVPAFIQHQIGLGRGRAVGGFGKDTASQLRRHRRVNRALSGRRHQHGAGKRKEFCGIEGQLAREGGQAALRSDMANQRGNVEAGRIVQRRRAVAYRDYFHP